MIILYLCHYRNISPHKSWIKYCIFYTHFMCFIESFINKVFNILIITHFIWVLFFPNTTKYFTEHFFLNQHFILCLIFLFFTASLFCTMIFVSVKKYSKSHRHPCPELISIKKLQFFLLCIKRILKNKTQLRCL